MVHCANAVQLIDASVQTRLLPLGSTDDGDGSVRETFQRKLFG